MTIRFEVSEFMHASPEDVFDALLGLDTAHRWMPGLVRIERLSPGPLAVGSEWRETRKIFGKEATEEFRLAGSDRPHDLELVVDGAKGSSGRGEYVFRYRIEPGDRGTDVRMSGEIRGLTGVMGWLGRLFVGSYRKACRKDLAALKAYLEGPPR